MKSLIRVGILLFSLSACTKTEYVDIDVDPQLELLITDESAIPVGGADVILYDTEEDFLAGENALLSKSSDSNGRVLFEGLSEKVYYFFASKAEWNNYYEVVTFENPLEKNEVRAITTIIR